MIVHVASQAEAKGRVVLRIVRDVTPAALDAAAIVARAYDAEIDAVLIEDDNLYAVTEYPFAREVSPSGRQTRALDARAITHAYAGLTRRAEALIAECSADYDVPIHLRRVRGTPREALAQTCAAKGPWNVVVFGEPMARDSEDDVQGVLEGIADTTGLVLVGSARANGGGAAIVVIERAEHLSPMLQIAERMQGENQRPVVIIPVPGNDDEGRRLDGDLRLALAVADDGDGTAPRLQLPHRPTDGSDVLAERIAQARPAVVIARGRGVFHRQTRPLAAMLRETGAALFLTCD